MRHKNVASTGAPLKHIMGNEFNIIQFILAYAVQENHSHGDFLTIMFFALS